MTTVKIDRKEFEKFLGKKFSDDYLIDRISMMGTPVEKITEDEIEIEIFPNRPDLLSLQGFARAFSSFIGLKEGLSRFEVKKSGEKVIIESSVKNVRPFTACAIVKGVNFKDEKIKEVIQIQEKLHLTFGRNRKKLAIGIYPYEKIKPPIRFIAKKPDEIKFRPLEYPTEITGRQILTMHPTGREYAHLLEGFDKFPIFIDSENKILSMPPIINSHDTGKITNSTRDVFIECSGFDLNVLEKCLNIIVTALSDMGGKIYSMELIYPDRKVITPDLTPKKMKIDYDYINRIIGLKLKKEEIKRLLKRMGFGIEKNNALVPAYRTDIMHQVDLAEDVAIAYGYENFKEEIPNVATIGEESKSSKLKNVVAEILTGIGMIEVNTYNLINKNVQTSIMNCKLVPVEILNSLSKEYDSLRTWMIPSIMEVFRNNVHIEYPQKIFDVGTVFELNSKEETGIGEKMHLAVGICHENAGYTEIRQVLDYLLRMLDLKYEIKEYEHSSFIPGRCGQIIINGKEAGFLGEIHPIVLENFNLEFPCAAMEIDLSKIFEL